MTREVDPSRVTLELIDDEDASRPFLFVEEEYPEDVDPRRVASLYKALLGDESEVSVAETDDGRPVVRMNTKEPNPEALRVASAIGFSLAARAGISEAALAEVADAVAAEEAWS